VSSRQIKQHLASTRMLFDLLVTGQVIPQYPAHAVCTAAFNLESAC
jgi:hypothetical protein